MPSFEELKSAYEQTDYCLPDLGIRLNIGQFSKGLSVFLQQKGVDQWAMITAYNPKSKLCSPVENDLRQEELKSILLKKRFSFFNAEHLDPLGNWPVEKSYFIEGIPLSDALRIGNYFDQNAIVVGNKKAIPQLFNCAIKVSTGD